MGGLAVCVREEKVGKAEPLGPRKPGGDEGIRSIDEVVRRDRPPRIKQGHDRNALAADALQRLKVSRVARAVPDR